MPEIRSDVVISGAGPNGLMLACELALAGVKPVVMERDLGPATNSKANGLAGQVVRIMDMRGLYPDGPPRPLPRYTFSGIPMDFTAVPDNPMRIWVIPQRDLTELPAARANELGVDVRRGHQLTGFVSTDDNVVVEVAGPDGDYRQSARYLVGADGGRSTVRKLSGNRAAIQPCQHAV